MTEIKLTTVTDEYMAQNVIDLLRSEGIDSYYVPHAYGDVTQVIAGHSITGYDILIRESDRQRAEEALRYFESDED